MGKITAKSIKHLRESTGAGYMDCKKALSEAGGDMVQAATLLRKKGVAIAKKKSSRTTAEGIVESYIHEGSKIGVLLEVNCETDFAATTKVFKEFVHDLAMHIAATSSNPANECKTASVIGQKSSLLDQEYYKDPNISVNDVVNACIARIGENITIKRFVRYEMGGKYE